MQSEPASVPSLKTAGTHPHCQIDPEITSSMKGCPLQSCGRAVDQSSGPSYAHADGECARLSREPNGRLPFPLSAAALLALQG